MTTTPPNADRLAGRHAVVIGGSMAGLVATRVLAQHFERVTLIERDQLPDGPEARKGVPQIRHVHVLLKRGETILAQYFPGVLDELRAAGSNCIDMAGDTHWFHFGGWKPRFKSGMEFYCQSRPFLEWKIRSRVAATSGVEILAGVEAKSFLTDASRSRVTGVMVARKSDADREEALAADLVVDASGRGSRTPAWLAALGVPEPEESVIKVDIGYATALVRPPANSARDWKALFVYMRPPETRLGVIVPVENGMWMVTLVGWFGDHPAGDPGVSSNSPAACRRSSSTRRSRTPRSSRRSRSTSSRPTAAVATSVWRAFPMGSPSSATRLRASIRSTARA
jgi:2-polyprenyl-6-methoxyphenol hydroxylase-like FAD-dependent oxidoreductase